MRRVTRLVGALTLLLGGTALGGTSLGGPASAATTSTAGVQSPAVVAHWSLSEPFTREGVKLGARDRGPMHIEHVLEVQLRLARAGFYRAAPDGVFGVSTENAVKAFQAKFGLAPTGAVNPSTWVQLIKRTTYGVAPKACTGSGWHMCVDRFRHQASLFRNGRMYNSWLVRTGAHDTQSRTGTFTVYWRDLHHVSSITGGPMPFAQFYSGGEALHGSVLMTNPFVGHSHGCVNFYLKDASQLWNLTHTSRLTVTVYGAWS